MCFLRKSCNQNARHLSPTGSQSINLKLTVFKQTTKRLIHPQKKKKKRSRNRSEETHGEQKVIFFNDDDDVVSVRTLKRKKDEAKSDPTVDSFFVGSFFLFLKSYMR